MTELIGKETVDNWTPIVTTWAIHTYILGDGRVTVLQFGSASDYIAVRPGYQIRNDGPATGRNDKTLNMYVHEYTGTTWKKRTQLRPNGGSICTISDGTDYVRLTFAYGSDSGMTLRQEDIETYAKPKQLGGECMTLMQRRRSLMGARGGELFPLYLYNEGVISPVAGSFTTDGYKYGSHFAQSQEDTYMQIISTNQYNIRGGRTFTTQSPIPRSCVGKTLRLTGTQTNPYTTGTSDMRNSYVYAFISDAVVTTSDTESVIDSGSFVDSISDRQLISGENITMNIDLSLVITKTGYVSIVAYKGYAGGLDVKIDKIWIE